VAIDPHEFIAMAGAVTLPIPAGDRLAFALFRNGTRVGSQILHFNRRGDTLTVHNEAVLKVKLLALTVFTYRAKVTEIWSNNAFLSADSQINDNGKIDRVHLRRTATGIAVSGGRIARYTAPASALPLTYWNKAMLNGPMINMQTGHTDRPNMTKLGWTKLPALPSGDVRAEGYQLTGPIRLSVYYDRTKIWSGLSFNHSGHIDYKPILG